MIFDADSIRIRKFRASNRSDSIERSQTVKDACTGPGAGDGADTLTSIEVLSFDDGILSV